MYKINDTEVYYNSDNPEEVVEMMRQDCYIPSQDKNDYMEKASVRFYNWDRTMLSLASAKRFVEDLLRSNYLIKLN